MLNYFKYFDAKKYIFATSEKYNANSTFFYDKVISVILENFRLCLIQRTLEELPDFEVMTWQLCRMLRSALNCFQVTRFCVQK